MEIYSKFNVGDMLLIYFRDGDIFDFTLVPESMAELLAERRTEISDSVAAKAICKTWNFVFKACELESMVQFKVAGCAGDGQHVSGTSMRNASCVKSLKFMFQESSESGVVTVFRDEKNALEFRHVVSFSGGQNYIETFVEAANYGSKEVKLEMIQAFSLGMLSPFQKDHAPGKYRIHRMQSHWSAECRKEEQSLETAGLEMSWQAAGMRSLRFGQRSTMPVKDYYPFAALEDIEYGVIWGAQLTAPGPWQMEVSRYCDMVNISGGMTDRSFSGWSKTLSPGGCFKTMSAVLSCVKGDCQALCSRLVGYQSDLHAPADAELPPFFNEYCTTWGDPVSAKLLPQLEAVKNIPFKYFILDDGWFRERGVAGTGAVGDWDLYGKNYPEGFSNFMDKIRSCGFIPGIWFEFENALPEANVVKTHPEYLLTLDGIPIQEGIRHFLDFRKPEVRQYLKGKVTDFLAKYNIGYIKVDYNACIGCGCDGDDSALENLNCHLENVASFFASLRKDLPELVIEVCSSGGHRISPAWVKFADVVSSSDAHEGLEIPVIAANVQQMIPLSKSQIWAVMRPDDSVKRQFYSLSAAMIGRMCLSGDMGDLNETQLAIADRAVRFYSRLGEVLKNGRSKVIQHISENWCEPQGCQVFECQSSRYRLVIMHTFAQPPEKLIIPGCGGNWQLLEEFASPGLKYACDAENGITIFAPEEFEGAAFLFECRK